MTTPSTPLDRLDGVTLFDVRELARRLAVSVRFCWRESAKAEVGLSTFPRPLRLGGRCARWRLCDVQTYLDSLATAGGRRP